MSRADKCRAVNRFLTSRSGIPALMWDGDSTIRGVPPYQFKIMTDAANWRFWEAMKALPDDGITGVIRYDKFVGSLNDAVVGVKLPTFAVLLAKHSESIQDRINTHLKGD